MGELENLGKNWNIRKNACGTRERVARFHLHFSAEHSSKSGRKSEMEKV